MFVVLEQKEVTFDRTFNSSGSFLLFAFFAQCVSFLGNIEAGQKLLYKDVCFCLLLIPLFSTSAIKRIIDEGTMDLEVIVNPKSLNGGVNVLQLETAVGAALKCFENGLGINVPR
jgi:hypothetical protein